MIFHRKFGEHLEMKNSYDYLFYGRIFGIYHEYYGQAIHMKVYSIRQLCRRARRWSQL